MSARSIRYNRPGTIQEPSQPRCCLFTCSVSAGDTCLTCLVCSFRYNTGGEPAEMLSPYLSSQRFRYDPPGDGLD
ncbi:hypothetical protein DdX_12283 [Ditylenchus destructor]|uniref:Uncharacterized protein n=1 Tax=Ditylenchus destructor TaxID=166010 RepID=A0AAD4R3V1_9BILA|nr:hypothetical protein DdX_12283 [Ditylenchus destructor]